MRSVMSQLTPATTCLVVDRMQPQPRQAHAASPSASSPIPSLSRRPGRERIWPRQPGACPTGPPGSAPRCSNRPPAGATGGAARKLRSSCLQGPSPPPRLDTHGPTRKFSSRRWPTAASQLPGRRPPGRCPHRPARWCSQVRPRAWGRGC